MSILARQTLRYAVNDARRSGSRRTRVELSRSVLNKQNTDVAKTTQVDKRNVIGETNET